MRFNDALIGAVLLLLSAAVFWLTRGFPQMPGQNYGPALFPRLIASGLGLCGVVLIVSGRRQLRQHPWLDFDEWTRKPGHLLDVGLVLFGIVAYILLSEPLGFLLTSFGLLTMWMTRFRGGRWPSSLAIAVVASLAIDYAFRKVLLVPLPLGPFVSVIW